MNIVMHGEVSLERMDKRRCAVRHLNLIAGANVWLTERKRPFCVFWASAPHLMSLEDAAMQPQWPQMHPVAALQVSGAVYELQLISAAAAVNTHNSSATDDHDMMALGLRQRQLI